MSAGPADLPANVRVFSVGKEKGWSEARRAVKFYRLLFSLLRRHRYDGCFAHMMPLFALMGAPLLKTRRIPVTLWFTHISTRLRLRLAVRVVDHVITADRGSFSLESDKLIVTGHGVDTDQFLPASGHPSGPPLQVLCVGRIDPIKRIDLLLDAIARLKSRAPDGLDLKVLIIGFTYPERRDYEAALHAQVERDGLIDVVRFEGPRAPTEMLDAYHGADVLVSLSRDNFDKVALEAMSCALPVITTNPAFGGLLHQAQAPGPTAADADAVADALDHMITMPSVRRRTLGAALREAVIREHSLETLVARLVDDVLFRPARRSTEPDSTQPAVRSAGEA
jgi:glycosyltransferase involved in cell wall biosynthesis